MTVVLHLLMLALACSFNSFNLQQQSSPSFFESPPIDESHVEVTTKASGKVSLIEVRFPTALKSGIPENDVVHSTVYVPCEAKFSKVPFVVILHAFASRDAGIERYLAKAFAHRGIAAAVMELPYHIHRSPKGMESGEYFFRTSLDGVLSAIRQAVMDAKRLIDCVSLKPFIDRSKVGVVGVSFGGIIATLLCCVDKRVNLCVDVLGGDLAITLWKSWLTRPFRRSLERSGITFESFRSLVRSVNPTTYAMEAQGKNILMVMSEYDLFVPKEACIELWRALGCPPMIRLYTGHLCSQLSAEALKDAITKFVEATFFLGLSATEAASMLKHVPSIAVKMETLIVAGGKVGVGVALELTDLDRARRTSLDLHLTTGGVYLGIQWEASHHFAIGACIRMDERRVLKPHISAFLIF
ncbi:MAG: hypothetical protein RUDDFDWM_001904 [Candidatus Fervidibacterota bacterium]